MTSTSIRRGRLHPVSVAPMMDHTDRHFRVFLRGLTRESLLYTEMITALAIRHGDREHLLGFSQEERPLALQLGGDDPQALAEAARAGQEYGYDEINLNVGCPSDRVQHGRFGACLMKEPAAVARAVAAMRQAVDLPVTVKHRLGVDEQDRYEDVLAFVDTVAAAGCDRFAVHARKAWLSGLSPKENRTVPPLRWEEVHRLKAERPQLAIEVNGGITTMAEIRSHLTKVDGVMIGRTAYEDPYLFATVDRELYGQPGPPPSRREVLERYLPYVEQQLRRGVPLARMSRHTTGLFAGVPGARAWKRHLAENAHKPGAGPEVLLAAAEGIPAGG
ncbi:MAG TPA: tRNA dihydrouridine(20/20a) synthase DusA [Thermoanaerobaculia bacterium]|nr:tRNA dihydrouridine(20/20a) synthase DusA [Thermoanaerobaculia bacterium]